jgi:cell division septal protein FtsQ
MSAFAAPSTNNDNDDSQLALLKDDAVALGSDTQPTSRLRTFEKLEKVLEQKHQQQLEQERREKEEGALGT